VISEHLVVTLFLNAEPRGWALRGGSLERGWHAVYKGKLRDYDAYLDVTDDWVYVQCPILRTPPAPACRAALHEYLLRVNQEMFFAKLGLTRGRTRRDGPLVSWVVLTSECPLETFAAVTFRVMLDAVATYAEQYVREVEAIALDEPVARLCAGSDGPGPRRAGR
jgi:hypothetical protein